MVKGRRRTGGFCISNFNYGSIDSCWHWRPFLCIWSRIFILTSRIVAR